MGVGKPTIGFWEVYRWGFGKRQEGIGKKYEVVCYGGVCYCVFLVKHKPNPML